MNTPPFIATKYLNLSEDNRSKWAAILVLLEDSFFSNLASGLETKISSKKYSVVIAALTYPSKTDGVISQQDLDRARIIANTIKGGVRSGIIKYTHAKIPSPWRIDGNPGSGR